MPRPILRLTTRRLLVGTGIIAAEIGLGGWAGRSAEYRQRVEFHEGRLSTLELVRRVGCYPYCSFGIGDIPTIYTRETAPFHERCVVYHLQMARKYRRAAISPWRTVEPDPPDPGRGRGGLDLPWIAIEIPEMTSIR